MCSFSGVSAMPWGPPMDSVTSTLASVSASLASLVSAVSAVKSATLDLDLKAVNVRRGVGGPEL